MTSRPEGSDYPRGPMPFDFHDLCNAPSFTIIGTHEMSAPAVATPDNPWTTRRHCEFFFDCVAERRIRVDSLVSHRVPFRRGPRSLRTPSGRSFGRDGRAPRLEGGLTVPHRPI
jgi:hypothetical protein